MTRVHAILGEPQVVLVVAALVGVALHLDERELGVCDERRARPRRGSAFDSGRISAAAGLEVDLLEDDDVVVLSMMTLPLSGQPSSSSKPL